MDPESATAGQPRSRTRRVSLFAVVAVLVLVLDQVSKYLIVAHLADRAPIRLLGGLLTITYTRNAGAAFSLGTGFTFIFTAVALAVIVVIIRTARRLYSVAWAIAHAKEFASDEILLVNLSGRGDKDMHTVMGASHA